MNHAKRVRESKVIEYICQFPNERKHIYLENLYNLIVNLTNGTTSGKLFPHLMKDWLTANYLPYPKIYSDKSKEVSRESLEHDIIYWYNGIKEIIESMDFKISNSLPSSCSWNIRVLKYVIKVIKCYGSSKKIIPPQLPSKLPSQFFIKIAGKLYPFSCYTFRSHHSSISMYDHRVSLESL